MASDTEHFFTHLLTICTLFSGVFISLAQFWLDLLLRRVWFFLQLFKYSGHESSFWGTAYKKYFHSVGFLFRLLVVCFALQKLFSLVWCHLLIISTMSCAAKVLLRRDLPYTYDFRGFILSSSRLNISVLIFILWSVLILVQYMVKIYESRFSLLHEGKYPVF